MRLYLPLTHLYQGVDLDPLPSSFPCDATMASGTCHLAAPRNPSVSHAIKTSSGKRASFRIVRKGAEPGDHGVANGDQEGQGEGEGDPPSHGVSPRPPPLPASRFRRARSIPSGLSPPRLPPTCLSAPVASCRRLGSTSLTRACPCALDLLVSFLRARPLAAWTTPARRRS